MSNTPSCGTLHIAAMPESNTCGYSISIDVIDRKKTPTREDALATRLKSLREGAAASPASSTPKESAAPPRQPAPAAQMVPPSRTAKTDAPAKHYADETADSVFETDDNTLEELLADVTPDENSSRQDEPSDKQVKALLEQLSKEVPQEDVSSRDTKGNDQESDSDDSDGEKMNRKADDVIERFRDEAELEASRQKDADDDSDNQSPVDDDGDNDDDSGTKASADLDMPSVPSNLDDLPSPASTAPKPKTVDDIAARMAALRAPSNDEDGDGGDSLDLPSVPTSRPAGKPVKRLTSRTNYTDDDVDSWCTVCLEDATLRCLGCDDDVYCTRCWKEMHVGPAAAFDDRTHRAVHFTRNKKKEKPDKVALGA